MADRPIIFSAPMVRALLDGRKTQTRRVLTHSCDEAPAFVHQGVITALDEMDRPYRWPKSHSIGDRLWVREAHSIWADAESAAAAQCIEGTDEPCIYRADYQEGTESEPMGGSGWRPSIHMPRWASRITLTVTDVRVQRLREISEADAVAEGVDAVTLDDVPRQAAMSRRSDFASLWNSIHGPGAWDANPWVCAITFTTHRCNIDQMEADHG